MVKVAANAKIAPHPYLLHNAGNCAARSRGQIPQAEGCPRVSAHCHEVVEYRRSTFSKVCLHFWDDVVDWL